MEKALSGALIPTVRDRERIRPMEEVRGRGGEDWYVPHCPGGTMLTEGDKGSVVVHFCLALWLCLYIHTYTHTHISTHTHK